MKASERKEQLNQQIGKINIEFSVDDELIALVHENTRSTTPRIANNILKCLTLIAGGTSICTACKMTGISNQRLTKWRKTEWYAKVIMLIQKRLDEQLDGKMTHMLNKGIKQVEQRLEHGDAVVSRTGEVSYKPVSAKDAAIITSIFFDKRNLLRNKPTTISTKVGTDEHLATLASKFKEIAIDADYTVVGEDNDVIGISQCEERSDDEQRLETQTTTSIEQADGAQLVAVVPQQGQVESKAGSDDSKFSFNYAT